MIKILPFILVPVLIVGILVYWRFGAVNQNLETPKTEEIEDIAPIEVPATLPEASLEDRVKSLEDTLNKVVTKLNGLKLTDSLDSTSIDSSLDGAVTELKARVSALEKATPAPVTSTSKSTVYIPLGSGGGPWANTDWYSTEYEVSLDPSSYPGYSGMVLEVTLRLVEAAGVGSVRLYNLSNSSAVSSQVDTTSTSFSLQSTSSFKLSSGTKTYKLQVKSSQGKDLFIQSARIKVNF